jgi:putative nucleotidyltransferase with HDIG domain
MQLDTPGDALDLLERLGATPWLVQHHRLVLEAAVLLCDGVDAPYDRRLVLVGAALHDVGKIEHPSEMSAAGHQHESAGRRLLEAHGVPDDVARFAVSHARWDASDVRLEDLLVAAADKLWKGVRNDVLESRLVDAVAACAGRARWEAFAELDALFERIAASGDDRLARSQV